MGDVTRVSLGVALVTGAAQGIGRACALALAADGFSVVCCDLETQREKAESGTVHQIREAGSEAYFCPCDVTKPEEIEAAVSSAVSTYGSLNASVAVVGGGPRVPFLEQTRESYEATVALTQHATFWQTQMSARQMVKQGGGGSIVIIGSIMADMACPTAATYSMGKCAIRQLGKTAAVELAPHGIRVNVVQPGYIDTPGERRLASEEEIANSALCIPLQRMGQPNDIGEMVSFLCSEKKASYVTGSVFDVDGGFKVALSLPGHTQDEGNSTKAQ